jgi:hypothetical protein
MVERLTQSDGSQVVIEVWSDLAATAVEASNEHRRLSLPNR